MNKEAAVEGAAVGVAAGLRQRKGEPTEEDVEAGDSDAPFEIESASSTWLMKMNRTRWIEKNCGELFT